MRTCCVPFCDNRENGANSFHRFPAKKELRNAWLRAILRRDESGNLWEPSKRSVVCDVHFAKKDYSVSTKRPILLPNAVPSIFPNYPAYVLQKSYELETDEDQLEKSSDIDCLTQNTNSLENSKMEADRISVFSSEKRKPSITTNEKASVKKRCVTKHFEAVFVECEPDMNQFEQNVSVQCPVQNANDLQSQNTEETISKLQNEIEALKKENSKLCNIIIALNDKINRLQKKDVSKENILENNS